VVIGLTASGRTPYVLGAMHTAAGWALHRVGLGESGRGGERRGGRGHRGDTGPEVIAGSTRMKAGTAQKLVLTAFSTAVMVRFGRTYSNLMVSMRATNAKRAAGPCASCARRPGPGPRTAPRRWPRRTAISRWRWCSCCPVWTPAGPRPR